MSSTLLVWSDLYFLVTYMLLQIHLFVFHKSALGYERVYLPLCKVADTPFHIQGDEILTLV